MQKTKEIEKSTVWNINAFNFFLYGSIGILLTFFPVYFESIGLSEVLIGLIMAGGPFVSIIANPFWGYWSDRIQNIKRIILIMIFTSLIVVQFVFQLDSITFVVIAMLVFFFFQMPMFAQSNSLILNTIEGTRYKFGAFRLWGSLGWSVMVMAAGPVLQKIGVGNLWIVYTFMLLLAIGATLRLPTGKVEGVEKIKKGTYTKELFGNKLFVSFILLGILISVPNSINQTFSSLYILRLGGTNVHIGWNAFTMAIFEIPIFLLLDRYLKRDKKTMLRVIIIVSFLFALRWFLMSLAVNPTQIIMIQVLHSITFASYYYIGTTLTAQLIPVQLRSSGQAIFAITWGGVSGLIAGLTGGFMYGAVGPSQMYGITTFIALAGAIGFIILYVTAHKKNMLAESDF